MILEADSTLDVFQIANLEEIRFAQSSTDEKVLLLYVSSIFLCLTLLSMLSQPSVMRDTFSFMPAFLFSSLFTVSTLHVASISLSIVLHDDEEQAEYLVVYDGDDDYDEDVDGEVNLVSQILCAGLVFQFKASRTRAPASRRP